MIGGFSVRAVAATSPVTKPRISGLLETLSANFGPTRTLGEPKVIGGCHWTLPAVASQIPHRTKHWSLKQTGCRGPSVRLNGHVSVRYGIVVDPTSRSVSTIWRSVPANLYVRRVRLTLEPLLQIGVGGDMLGQHLDGDGSIESSGPRLVDFSHAPGPDGSEDLVGAERGAGLEWHGYGTGTRSFSSSNELRTTLICGSAASSLAWTTTRSACPSGVMS